MKSFLVFCVLKIIAALAEQTNGVIPKKHGPMYIDSVFFNGDRDIPYFMRSRKNLNYNNENSKQENKIEGHKIISVNDLPHNYIEVANYDPADVHKPDIGPARRSSNSNSGVNINNNVSDNMDAVEVNNIQQENKNFDSQLKANFIELLNSYNNPTDQKLDSHHLSQEHAENKASSNANNDVNINNNVNNNMQKVEINNIHQKNELNRRRMNINSKLNAKLFNKNIGNSYVEANEERQTSVINSLPLNGPKRRYENLNFNTGVDINNDVYNNLDKIELGNIQQKNKQSRKKLGLKSAINAQISQLQPNNVIHKSLINNYLYQRPARKNSNANSGVNINNDVHENLGNVQLGNIQQKNEESRKRINLQSTLMHHENSQLQSNLVNQKSAINSYPFQGSTRRKVNSNINSGININNDVYDNFNKVQLDNIQQKNKQNRKKMYTQSTLYTDLSKENEQEMDLLALLSPEKKSLENLKLNINKKLNINNNLNHNVQKVVISNVNQKNMETIKKMNVQSILSYFSYFIHHPPKDKDLNALKLKKETYMTMLKYFIKYLGEMGVPDSEIVYYIQQAQSYETDAKIREKYNKLINSYQTSNQNLDIDGVISNNQVTIIPVEDEGIIRDENLQFALSNFNYFLHNAPKDENLSALKQKRKIYLLELLEYIKYLEAIGVSDLQIVWYLEEAQKYESDEELRAIYTQTIDTYKNASPNAQQSHKIEVQLNNIILSILGIDGDINAMSSIESTVNNSHDFVRSVNNSESSRNVDSSIINNININNNKHHNIQNIQNNHLHERNQGNVKVQNIQFLLNYFNYFLHHAPKDNNLDALQNKRKHYLLELFELVKYLKASGISKLNILQYLQDAVKYETDSKLQELYWKLIHSIQSKNNSSEVIENESENGEPSPSSEEILPNNSSEQIENGSGNKEPSPSSEEILPNNSSEEKDNKHGNENPSSPSEEILPDNSSEEKDNESGKESSPTSEEILPNNSSKENESGNEEPTPNNSSEDILPNNSTEEIEPTENNTETPTHDETTPHWEPENTLGPNLAPESTPSPHLIPEDTPLPYWIPETTLRPEWEPENTLGPNLGPENTPLPYWIPETTPLPYWVPKNEEKQPCTEVDKSGTDSLLPVDEVNSPNIVDVLKHPFIVFHNKYMENMLTNLILHLKDNGVSDEEIQEIVQISLINVISSMAQHSVRECQEKILSDIRHNLQLSLYKYLLHKCRHSLA